MQDKIVILLSCYNVLETEVIGWFCIEHVKWHDSISIAKGRKFN